MIPFTTTRINYSAIIEADNKADRERQLRLKVSDEKRRKMKGILTENSMLRFNQLKNNISKDHAPILHRLKDSLLNLDSNIDKNIQPRVFEDHNSTLNIPNIKLDDDKKIGLHRVPDAEKNLVQARTDNINNDANFIQSDDLIENQLSSLEDEVPVLESLSLNSLASNLENIIDDIKSKKSSAEILLRIQAIEQGMSQEIIESKIFSQVDISDLNCQIDFLEGYLQSEFYSKDIQNKLIESLNNSRNHLAQIENNNLLQKEIKPSDIENKLLLTENIMAMMSPQVPNSFSTSKKIAVDNAVNKNNQVNGTARLQQKNKDETLPLVVVRSV